MGGKYRSKLFIKISVKQALCCYELKQHKLRFDKERSKLFDQRKQTKLQRSCYPHHMNRDNLNNVRHETSRDSREEKKQKGVSERQN
jgi:hypothetical protein